MKIIDDNFIRVKSEGGKIYSVVEPYWKRYLVYVKLRWQFKSISEVFAEEFNSLSKEYWDWAIKNQFVLINDKPCDLDTILHNGDKIEHNTLKIERAGTNQYVQILEEDDDMIAAYKPPGIPSHPCGMYEKMSLHSILKQGLATDYLYLLSRLDRVTSGIILLCKHKEASQRYTKRIQSSEKIYFALVYGDFDVKPDYNYERSLNDKTKYRAITNNSKENSGSSSDYPKLRKVDFKKDNYLNFNGDWCICTAKLKTLKSNYRNPLTVEHNEIEGKECETWFKKILFDGTYSLVIARLLTGRTHQIRAHLGILGFPIVNDHHYSNRDKFFHKTDDRFEFFKNEKEIDVCYSIINKNNLNIEPLVKENQMGLEFALQDLKSIFYDSTLSYDEEKQTLQVKYLVEDPLEICLFAYCYFFKQNLESNLNIKSAAKLKENNTFPIPEIDNLLSNPLNDKPESNDSKKKLYKCNILPSWLTKILDNDPDCQDPIKRLDSFINNLPELTKS